MRNSHDYKNSKEYVSNRISDKRLKTASVLGFIFGIFGIHDFTVGRYAGGITHVAILIFTIIITPICLFLAGMGSASPNMTIETKFQAEAVFYAPFVLIIISYIWAMVESINFINIVKLRIDNYWLPSAQKEKLKRRNFDYMVIAITIATIIVVPLIIAFFAIIISTINYR
ncbi:hypothetical protein IKE97_03195 [Candidatus Saccharibacteria bacterium]|nr:hypothetical protein [Candidatus Saccharibacteria bacterium]